MPESTIHIRVPSTVKGRWVRESRAAKIRLGDWIIRAVEAQHPDYAYCMRCECDVTYILDGGDALCPRCNLVL